MDILFRLKHNVNNVSGKIKMSSYMSTYLFQIMMQKKNRHMSFSLYISVLSVTDSITLLISESDFILFKCSIADPSSYRSGTVNSNTVNSKFHLIRSY